ncbi:uncharacterized protein EAE97_011905 [Botrytis byssoidea]|uniref:2EXR domain-containing protein n=1 Tax=Botrytis byssoidea TaxID=139641 RepID=A0A9P5HU46_9HELO|nr:uncharacterized protein EAE97_011905 [Botrytis byssoidea]KAF7918134.1 hypothetical protein EAE97_011905 [Botrytis byssoidea]
MAVTTLKRFTCFPQLPLELQMIILSFCPYVDKQVINITDERDVILGRGSYRSISRGEHRSNQLAVDFPEANFIDVQYNVPSPFQICQKSRNVALQHYRRVATTYGDTKYGSHFYINPHRDSIFFEDIITVLPFSDLPTIDFWRFNGKTLSTPDGGTLCTSVATYWAKTEPPSVDHLMYTLSKLPEVKHLYFLNCPSGPFPVSSVSQYIIQWMSRDRMEELAQVYINLLLGVTNGGTLDCSPDSTDIKERRGIFRSSWVLPILEDPLAKTKNVKDREARAY